MDELKKITLGLLRGDAFAELDDPELLELHRKNRLRTIQEGIVKDIRRGVLNKRYILDKYTTEGITEKEILDLIEESKRSLVSEFEDYDIGLEVIQFLSSNKELTATMFDMLDSCKDYAKPRTVVELVNTIKSLKKDRMDFLLAGGVSLNTALKELGILATEETEMKTDVDFKALLEKGRVIQQSKNGD